MKQFLLLITLTIAAVAAQHTTQVDEKPKPAPFEEKDWELKELNGGKLPDGVRVIPWLHFSRGRVTGNSGCNRMFGSYETKEDTLKFGMIGGTMMACAPPEIEGPTMKALNKVARYRLAKDAFELLDKDDVVVARFVAR